jgi:uncharacterized membrane protein SpoIIM required for sporulation
LREALFIKRNKDRWTRIEEEASDDPDEMASDFTQLVNDLAYAKTFYPSGKVTKFVNTQASKIYLDIYKNRKEESNRIIRFWKYDLPLTIRKHYKVVIFSFLFFFVFFLIGFFATAKDPDVPRQIFGDGYVDDTIDRIEKGNPFGIYEKGNPILSWLSLMIHNIRVSLLMFASGIFGGVFSLYLSAQNAVMLGAFDQFFSQKGLGIEFWMVVFVHGTLEITAIIISSAAGIVLGKSFLFPGTIKRIDAFKQGAKDGVKIMIGLMPVFALAAFFEGFITRLYNDLSWLTTGIFLLSVAFVIWYFIIYPYRLGKKFASQLNEEEV